MLHFYGPYCAELDHETMVLNAKGVIDFQYDQYGHAAFENGGSGGMDFSSMDFSSMFGDLFGGLGGIFGDLFGGGRSNGGPQRGANSRIRIRITFEEAMKGVDKEIEVNLKEQ